MRHLLGGDSLALVTARQATRNGIVPAFMARSVIDAHAITDATSISTIFPLFLRSQTTVNSLFSESARQANISVRFEAELRERLAGSQHGGAKKLKLEEPDVTPERMLEYIYSILHSPAYGKRYAEFLKIDFPRVPLVGNQDLFRALYRLGGELVALHLLKSPKLDRPTTVHTGSRLLQVEKASWSKDTVWVDKAKTAGFSGVREEVWNFQVGGFQVCEKWLKDRKGRTLSDDDIAHYQKIVVALSETIRLMAEIDTVIDAHGGWPGAFQTAAQA